MACDKELSTTTSHNHAYTTLWRFCQQSELWIGKNILAMNFGMTTMWHHKHIVEPAEYGQLGNNLSLREDSEHFLLERIFGHTVVMIQSGLSRPTDEQCTCYVGLGPIKNICYLIPIRNLLKLQRLNGGASNDHTIELLVTHRFEIAIEHHHVFNRSILWSVTLKLHKAYLHLQWSV